MRFVCLGSGVRLCRCGGNGILFQTSDVFSSFFVTGKTERATLRVKHARALTNAPRATSPNVGHIQSAKLSIGRPLATTEAEQHQNPQQRVVGFLFDILRLLWQ